MVIDRVLIPRYRLCKQVYIPQTNLWPSPPRRWPALYTHSGSHSFPPPSRWCPGVASANGIALHVCLPSFRRSPHRRVAAAPASCMFICRCAFTRCRRVGRPQRRNPEAACSFTCLCLSLPPRWAVCTSAPYCKGCCRQSAKTAISTPSIGIYSTN